MLRTARAVTANVRARTLFALIVVATTVLASRAHAQTLRGERVAWRPVGALGLAAGATLTGAAIVHLLARTGLPSTLAPSDSFYVPLVGPLLAASTCRASRPDAGTCDALVAAGAWSAFGDFVGLGLLTAFLAAREPWFVPAASSHDVFGSPRDPLAQFEPRRASRRDDGDAPTVGMRRQMSPFWPLVTSGATLFMASHLTAVWVGVGLVHRDATSLFAAIPVVGPAIAAAAGEPCLSREAFSAFFCAFVVVGGVMAALPQIAGLVLMGVGLRARSSWFVPDVTRDGGARSRIGAVSLVPSVGSGAVGLDAVGVY